MRRPAALLVLGALGVGATGCRDGKGNTGEEYCTVVAAHLETLNSPDIDSGEDIFATLSVYRDVTASAPVAIEPEWQQVLTGIETASTVNAADPESVQLAADTARRSKAAATKVQQYTQQLCALNIGNPPPITDPVTVTSTIPGPNTSAPPTTGQTGG